jgi:hypothetical protein
MAEAKGVKGTPRHHPLETAMYHFAVPIALRRYAPLYTRIENPKNVIEMTGGNIPLTKASGYDDTIAMLITQQ